MAVLRVFQLFTLALMFQSSTAQRAFDTTSYALPHPAGWDREIFPIPIAFAKSIPYAGQEELRFAPGWGDSASAEYWSYAFVWFIDGHPDITAEGLQDNLEAYYNGLIGTNIEKRKIPASKLFPVKAKLEQLTGSGSDRVFAGNVHMLDYMAQKPIVQHVRVRATMCAGEHTAVLFEISPSSEGSDVRTKLRQITEGFHCGGSLQH